MCRSAVASMFAPSLGFVTIHLKTLLDLMWYSSDTGLPPEKEIATENVQTVKACKVRLHSCHTDVWEHSRRL